MKGFNPIIRRRVNPVDLDVVANTYRELEQGHRNSIQLTSQLQTAMAQLPLNEAEDSWRQNKIQQIRDTLENNLNYGNAAGAYDDLVRVQGDITSDPGLIGRIRAQQDYTKYMEDLNNRQDLSEYHKNYYRQNTKYSYSDIIDNRGKVIGGTKWTPTERPVSHIDMNKIYSEALKYVSPDAGGYDRAVFMDPTTGKISNTYSDGMNLVRYNTVTSKYEILPPEKLRSAIDAVIKANPAIRASLEQDYKIDKWYHSQDPTAPSDVIDAKGYTKSFEQYIDDKIDPFIKAKQYRHIYTSNNYNDSMINAMAKASLTNKKSDNAQDLSLSLYNAPTTKGPRSVIKINPGLSSITNIRENGSIYSEELNSKYPNLNIPTFNENTTKDSLADFIKNNNINQEVAIDIYTQFDKFIANTLAARITKQNVLGDVEDPNKTAAYNFYAQLSSGFIDDMNDNDSPELRAHKKWNADLTNTIFGDSAGVGIILKDQRMLDSFKRRLGNLYSIYGIKQYAAEDGHIKVVLPAESKDGLYKFADAGNYAVTNNRTFFSNLFNRWGKLNQVNDDGEFIKQSNIIEDIPRQYMGTFSPGYSNNITSLNNTYINKIKELEKLQEDILPEGGEITVNSPVINYVNPEARRQDVMYQSSETSSEANLHKNLRDDQLDKWNDFILRNPELIRQGKALKVDEDGLLSDMDNDDVDNYLSLIAKSNDKNITSQMIWLPAVGYRPKFTINDGENNYEYVLLEGFKDNSFDAANNTIDANVQIIDDKLKYRGEAFDFPTLNGQNAIIINKTTGTTDVFDNEGRIIRENISEPELKAYERWAVVSDRIEQGNYTENDVNVIASAYNDLLIAKGYLNEEDRRYLVTNFIEQL